MSWWDTSNFANLATQALKNAQKKIDKVLDIKENDSIGSQSTVPDTKSSKSSKTLTESSGGDFWNTWLGSGGDEAADDGTGSKSSWSFPWGGDESGNSKGSPKSNQGQGAFGRGKTAAAATELKKEIPIFSGLSEEKTLKKSEQNQIASDACQAEEWSEVLDISAVAKDSGINVPQSLDNIASSQTQYQKNAEDEGNALAIIKEKSSFANDRNQTIAASSSLQYIVSEKNIVNAAQTGENISHITQSIFLEEIDEKKIRDIEGADNLISGIETTVIRDSENVKQFCNEKEELPMSISKLTEPSIEDSSYRNKPDSIDSIAGLSESSKHGSLTAREQFNFSAAFDTGMFSSAEIVSKDDFSEMEMDVPFLNAESDISAEKRDSLIFSLTHKRTVNESSETVIVRSESKFQIPENSSLSETASDENMDNNEGGEVVYGNEDNKKEDNSKDNSDMMAHPDAIGQAGHSGEVTLPEGGMFSRESDCKKSPSQGSDLETSKLDISMETQTSEDTLVEQDSMMERELFHDETYLEESKKSEAQENNLDIPKNEAAEFTQAGFELNSNENKDMEGDITEISPSSSFVMLEDATDDNSKHNDNNSDTHSSYTEKSEFSRSIHSNQESSDEIDTTTSSDIEIISIPTPNGENRQTSPVDPIPLRIAISRNVRDSPLHSHKRADSFSSTSTNSKDGSGGQMSPGRDHELAEDVKEDFRDRVLEEYQRQRMTELPALDEEDDNPLHPQRLLKKLAEMARIVEVRESKLVQLSRENMDLLETNNILKSQLQQLEEAREAEMADINVVTTEFTQRMADMEKRLQAAIREKEMFKSQVQQAQEELQKRAHDASLAQHLAEKDMQIAELMQEGEKLSKQQLQNSTVIKKLRAKEKENESVLSGQKKKLESRNEELEHLYKVLESKEDLEKKQTEAIHQLNIALQKLEKEVSRQKSDLDDAEEKVRSLQTALDNSYREIAELHKSNAVQDSKLQEAALSAEIQVREELKFAMEKQQQQFAHEKESLIMQIEDLRMSIARTEKEHSRREDMLRQEITDLQHHLQEDEARNQELTQSVTFATRPLLRQIENLQSTYSAQSSTWERVEKNLTDRLSEVQNQLAVAMEKERSMTEQGIDMRSRVTALESQNSLLRQEKSQLTVDLEMAKARVEVLEDAKNKEIAQSHSSKQQLLQDLNEIKREKVFLETQLDMEKTKVEQEKKKVAMCQEQIKDMERELQRTQSRGTPSPISISRHDSVSSFGEHATSFMAISQDDIDRSFLVTTPTSRQSLYETLRQNGAASLLENLQSQLKLKEGEIIQLQSEIQQLERTRESMARELVNLSNENEKLKEQVEELPELIAKFKEQNKKNEALLLMYGEKVEEANELRMDLHDIKEMYKSQIDHLLAK